MARREETEQETEAPPPTATLGVGMVGYAFMGAAHSQGWRTAGRVFDLPLRPGSRPRSADATGRPSSAAADRHGWAAAETDWRALIARDDVAAGRHLHPRRQPRGDRHRRAGGGQARAVREAARQHGRGGRGDGRGRRSGPRPAARWRWWASTTAGCPPSRSPAGWSRRAGSARLRHVRVTYLQDWLVDPEFPLTWRLQQGARRIRRARRPRARTSSTSPSTWRASRWPGCRR